VTSADTTQGDDVLIDAQGAIGRAYGLGDGGLALIRPDGYIGLLAARSGPDVLRGYLHDVLQIREVSRV
jgi:hypothetical protein